MDDVTNARLLIVDDEKANITILERVLVRAGYNNIEKTTDPREALRLFEEDLPDLVLLDLSMPHMDGFEVMGRLVELSERGGAKVPILMLTADTSPETRQRALTSGANDFLGKPFKNDEVLARVANLLETRRLYLELHRQKEHLAEEVEVRTAELKETESRLSQAQKMEAVGQLAGGIAHDFNNLLAVIINYSILLLEDMDPEDDLREEVDEIKRAAESAATLTRQLLAFSRKEVVQSVVLDLNGVVLGTKGLLRRTIGEHIELETSLAEDLPRTKLDPGQLEQVLLNLAVNARDAMPDGGTLSIDTFAMTMDEEFASQHPGAYAGDYACLRVSDTGTGMTEEVRAHLFEPFFTTKERGVGTGLGLATVYGVVKQADGYIDVESELGVGSRFTVYFRTTSEPLEDAEASTDAQGESKGETILVVEDADALRKLIERLLVRNGFDVLTSPRGDQALELAKKRKGSIHVLLTDVVMPGMSGKALADAFVELYPETPVIFMSGYTDQIIKEHSLAENRFLRKPFTEKELVGVVHETLREAQAEGTWS